MAVRGEEDGKLGDCIPFRIYVGESLPAVVAELRNELMRRGAAVSGDADRGNFSTPLPVGGVIAGSYAVAGKSLAITISQRPAAISCGTIESKLQDAILNAKATIKNRQR